VSEGRSLGYLSAIGVEHLKAASARKVTALNAAGIESILDLVWHYPRRYIDRSRQAEVADLVTGDKVVVLATVKRVALKKTKQGRALVDVEVADATGVLRVVFFNQAWRAKQLNVGTEALFDGTIDTYRGERQMTNPVVDVLVGAQGQRSGYQKTDRVIAIYPQSAKVGLTSWNYGVLIEEALRRTVAFADPLEDAELDRYDLLDRSSAMRAIHQPETLEEVEPARRRLAFDELFRLQLALRLRRAQLQRDARGIAHRVDPREAEPGADASSFVGQFLGSLGFEPTAAQRRVIAEIFGDLAAALPMNRLLQGDVGSGKTVVAVASMLAAVQGGHQAALMAPTEVLAEQHYLGISALLENFVVLDPERLGGTRALEVRLLTGSVPAAKRRGIAEGIANGDVDIVIGTQALLSADVSFGDLGVVVVDEQHRFGVQQRAALRESGRRSKAGADPDLLIMTATPIPRTAAMVAFGDLEMSVLDEMPAGRTPIVTHWAQSDLEELEAWGRVREEISKGRQAYVVCPLVEGSDRLVARSATQEFERLGVEELAGLRLGLMHGQMKTPEKEAVMAAFRRHDLDVLVATTVIEVGVDVPNATVMVIEDAGRFGIAQLHQLRGRVGRGANQSYCYVLSGEETSLDAKTRLGALEASTDGFALAEIDLDLRGEGTILGSRQKGRSDLTLAKLSRDQDLMDMARELAVEIVGEHGSLAERRQLADELEITLDPEDAAFLFKS
jgi:ATP-dependent DNA helicase RecG